MNGKDRVIAEMIRMAYRDKAIMSGHILGEDIELDEAKKYPGLKWADMVIKHVGGGAKILKNIHRYAQKIDKNMARDLSTAISLADEVEARLKDKRRGVKESVEMDEGVLPDNPDAFKARIFKARKLLGKGYVLLNANATGAELKGLDDKLDRALSILLDVETNIDRGMYGEDVELDETAVRFCEDVLGERDAWTHQATLADVIGSGGRPKNVMSMDLAFAIRSKDFLKMVQKDTGKRKPTEKDVYKILTKKYGFDGKKAQVLAYNFMVDHGWFGDPKKMDAYGRGYRGEDVDLDEGKKLTVKAMVPDYKLSDRELIQRVKAYESDAQKAYGLYVKGRALKPSINAKEFISIFNSVSPNLHNKITTVDFEPTHVSKSNKDLTVMVTSRTPGVVKYVLSYGGTGSDPAGSFDSMWKIFKGGRRSRQEDVELDEGRLSPGKVDLGNSVYTKKEKPPKFNVAITPLSDGGAAGAALLRRRLPDWSKADHQNAISKLKRMKNGAKKKYDDALDAAAQETWGRPWEITDYRVSGIGSSEFSSKRKDELRTLNKEINDISGALGSHEYVVKHFRLNEDVELDEGREPKLKTGDVIRIDGFVMMKGLDGGKKYRVKKVDEKSYWFTKLRGSKVVARHYITSVDRFVRSSDHGDINKIVIAEDVDLDGEEISEMWGQIGSDYPSGLGKDLNKAMRFFEHMTNSLADAKKYLNKAISGKKYAPQAKNAIDELNNISGYAKTAQRKIEKAFSKV